MRHAAFDLDAFLDQHVIVAGGTAAQRATVHGAITQRLQPTPDETVAAAPDAEQEAPHA